MISLKTQTEPFDIELPQSIRLDDLLGHLKRNKIFHYIYDFGDDWWHTVKL